MKSSQFAFLGGIMDLSRRRFLYSTLACASFYGLGGCGRKKATYEAAESQIFATSIPQERCLVAIYVNGGMDSTLGLDPWIDERRPPQAEAFIEYAHDDLIREGNIYLGPSAAPIRSYMRHARVVNGVFLSDTEIGHIKAKSYMARGTLLGQEEVFVRRLAAADPSSFGFVTNDDFEPGNLRTPVFQLKNAFAALETENPAEQMRRRIEENGIHINPEHLNAFFDELKRRSEEENEDMDEALMLAIAAGLGFSKNAWLVVPGMSLDTHSDHVGRHIVLQRQAWEFVARVMSLFKKTPEPGGEGSLFDRTVFLVLTEFARTPVLNVANGKDHNAMTNSVIFFSSQWADCRAIGASRFLRADESSFGRPVHRAVEFDFLKGQSAPSGGVKDMLRPENVVRTAFDLVSPKLSVPPSLASTKVLPLG